MSKHSKYPILELHTIICAKERCNISVLGHTACVSGLSKEGERGRKGGERGGARGEGI